MSVPNGDLYLARDYLQRVAGSNAEEVGRASEMLKTVKITILEREAKTKAEAVPAQTPTSTVTGQSDTVMTTE